MIAALLILLGLLSGASYLLSGPGRPLAAALGPAAGSPWLVAGGAVALGLGLLVAGREREPGQGYATREVILLLAAASAGGLTVALLVGVARGWSWPTLGALAAGAWAETLLAVALTVILAVAGAKRRPLFLAGLLATVLLGAVHLALIAVVAA